MRRLREQIASVFGWVKKQVRSNPLLSIPVMVLAFLLIWVMCETIRLKNLGLSGKTFWDWMELLVIPIVLAIGAWWLNKSERENELRIADERQRQAILEAYFDRMAELLLKERLRESSRDGGVRSIARSWTLAVLRSLDGRRKGQVVQFLYESRLIDLEYVVWLSGADLTEADLTRAVLTKVNLYEANLNRANLSEANLLKANLGKTDLRGANLHEAFLAGADLSGAKVTNKQLDQARTLIGAIMPDGTHHE
jgi:uncharacterized protein YjbI with pentapeptide repeats